MMAGLEGLAPMAVTEASVRALYVDHYRRLVSLAHLLTGSNEVAEDLVQDCFARLLRRRSAPDNAAGYLRTSVVNAVRSWQRRQVLERTRRPPVERDTLPPDVDGMRAALAVLRPRQRAAIVLRFYEDLPEAEIATVLDCRPGTVKSLISRGLETLRKEVPTDESRD
jgi:RNA polymerase sigma factor (sigma-70 family)